MIGVARFTKGLSVICCGVGLSLSEPAKAHPHVVATVKASLVFSEDGRLQSIHQYWTFDAFFSAFAKRQIDTNKDGIYSPNELEVFANQQLRSLRDFKYFTTITSGDTTVPLDVPASAGFAMSADGGLTFEFVLALQTPLALKQAVSIEIFDPNFFAYFTFDGASEPVRLIGAQRECTLALKGPKPINFSQPSTVPAVFWKALDGATDVGRQFSNLVVLTCAQ